MIRAVGASGPETTAPGAGAEQREAPNAARTLGASWLRYALESHRRPDRSQLPTAQAHFAAPERPVGAGGRTPVAAEPEVGCSRGPKQSGRENA